MGAEAPLNSVDPSHRMTTRIPSPGARSAQAERQRTRTTPTTHPRGPHQAQAYRGTWHADSLNYLASLGHRPVNLPSARPYAASKVAQGVSRFAGPRFYRGFSRPLHFHSNQMMPFSDSGSQRCRNFI